MQFNSRYEAKNEYQFTRAFRNQVAGSATHKNNEEQWESTRDTFLKETKKAKGLGEMVVKATTELFMFLNCGHSVTASHIFHLRKELESTQEENRKLYDHFSAMQENITRLEDRIKQLEEQA